MKMENDMSLLGKNELAQQISVRICGMEISTEDSLGNPLTEIFQKSTNEFFSQYKPSISK